MISQEIQDSLVEFDDTLKREGLYSVFTYSPVKKSGKKDEYTGKYESEIVTEYKFNGLVTGTGTSLVRNGEPYSSTQHKELSEVIVISLDFQLKIGQAFKSDGKTWYLLEFSKEGGFELILGRS